MLECTGESYFDDADRIWSEEDYPSRLPVRVVSKLEPEESVPVRTMLDDLDAFEGLRDKAKWGTLFMGSLNRWSDHDGRTVEAALDEAARNPVRRPLPSSARRGHVRAAVDTESGPVTVPDEQQDSSLEVSPIVPTTETEHTWAQLTLAKLGAAMGYEVYVPANDRGRTFNGERVNDVPGMVESLNLPLISAAQRIIKFIDVLWLDRDAVVAAFEIECTTSVYSGILRMTDLLALQPNLRIECFIAAPDSRADRVFQKVNRPTFARMRRPFSSVCRFIPFSALKAEEGRGDQTWRHLKFSYIEQELAEELTPNAL